MEHNLRFLLLSSLVQLQPLVAQTFTRVTDPNNAITTDLNESGGGSWVDVNADGRLDLFVSNGNLTDRDDALYLNLNGSDFVKVTTGATVNSGGSSIGSTWSDYNDDGHLDCFVTNRNNFGNFLYHGTGDTVFTAVTAGNVVSDMANSNSSSWVDADGDGDLDLYVVNFQGADLLYLNSGSPDHELVPAAPINGSVDFSIPGAWADHNNDRQPDLFIGNSGNQNDVLYTNNGGLSYTPTPLTDGRATLGASWADYDNDGDLDLYVANFLNGGNVYYTNSGVPDYQLSMNTTGTLAVTGNCVGSAWGDVDNDGDLDLFVSNDGDDNFLFLNSGPPNYDFTQVTTGDIVTDGGQSFGCVFGDYDNDGQLDLYVANRLDQQSFLYHNDGNGNHWTTITCQGASPNQSAIGAKVWVKANINGLPTTQMQEVSAQTGYNSQNLWLHFGLGDATNMDTVIIQWASGGTDTCLNVISDQRMEAVEGGCLTATSVGRDGMGSQGQIMLYPNPGSNVLNVLLPGNAKSFRWSVIAADGKTVATGRSSGAAFAIDVSDLKTGRYTVRCELPDGPVAIPFIKQETDR